MGIKFKKDIQYYKFCLYGFLKNLKFFEPFLILFFIEKGLSFLQIGTIYAAGEITKYIFEIPTGIIADAVSRRRTMILAFIFYIISFIIYFFSTQYLFFFIAVIIFSFGEGFRTGTHKAMIFEYLQLKGWNDQKVHYYGHTRSWSQMGSALSSLIAASIVFFSGSYKFIFIYSTIPYLLDLLLMISYPKELDGNLVKLEGRKISRNFKIVIKEFILSLKKKFILVGITNLSVYSGFYKAVKDYLQPVLKTFALALPIFILLEDKQRSAIVIGIVYFIIYFLTSYASRKSGNTADKFKNINLPLNITLVVGFAMGILAGVFYNLQFTFLAILFYLGIYLIENLRNPMGVSYVSEMFDQDILATALSAKSQAKTIAAAIIAPLLGYFADKHGIGNSLIIISLLLILTAPLYLLKKKHRA